MCQVKVAKLLNVKYMQSQAFEQPQDKELCPEMIYQIMIICLKEVVCSHAVHKAQKEAKYV